YIEALKLLARRELSEAQVRRRLARQGHPPDAIDEAVSRLVAERAIDDERTAGAIARTEVTVRRRGKLRVRLQIERAGIDRHIARRAADAVFDDLDADTLLDASLVRRLGGRETIDDERERQRLYRYLVGQGFDPERVIERLNRTRSTRADK